MQQDGGVWPACALHRGRLLHERHGLAVLRGERVWTGLVVRQRSVQLMQELTQLTHGAAAHRCAVLRYFRPTALTAASSSCSSVSWTIAPLAWADADPQ